MLFTNNKMYSFEFFFFDGQSVNKQTKPSFMEQKTAKAQFQGNLYFCFNDFIFCFSLFSSFFCLLTFLLLGLADYYYLQIMLLGDPGCGRTSLSERYFHDEFAESRNESREDWTSCGKYLYV